MSKLFEKIHLANFLGKLDLTAKPLELEVRYGNVNFKEFQRVREYLMSVYGKPSISNTEDIKKGYTRQTVTTLPDGSFTYESIDKQNFGEQIKEENLGVKIALSTEVKSIISKTSEIITDPELRRNKHRESWMDATGIFRFDLTRVVQTAKGEEPKQQYEVEIEMILPLLLSRNNPLTKQEKDEFTKAFLQMGDLTVVIKGKIQDTDIAYTAGTKLILADFINSSIDAYKYKNDPRDYVRKGDIINFAVQARNIKYRDMVYGGLLNKEPGVTYSVTVKAEGVRKFMVIHSTGLWLVYPSQPSNEVCKVSSFDDLPPSWKSYVGTILDGEDIPEDNRTSTVKTKHYYLPFDTLLYNGKDVSSEPLEKRLRYTKTICGLGALTAKNGTTSVVLEQKPFYFFSNTPESFYSAIEKVEKFIPKYIIDGFIFTPNNTVYNPQSEKVKGELRQLRKVPDICKWKPFDQLTIDFAYYYNSTRKYLSVGNSEFKGSRNKKFDCDTQVDWVSPILKDLPQGTVVEFEPRKILNEIIMTPKKVRFDKQYPNSLNTASDVWDDINDPIKIETLRGETMDLMRKYHNVIKRALLDDVPEGAHLIDIGSGRGGDLSKMRKFSKVLCIEPDSANLNGPGGLRERLSEMKDKDKFHILQCGGEATDKIMEKIQEVFSNEIGTKPVYISMMLSLSFFWGKEEMLRSLVETLLSIKKLFGDKNEVKFIFLTIEGDRTLELLNKYNNSIRFPSVIMDYNPEKQEVYIDFPGTIVGKQTEYIVKLKELPLLLEAKVDYEKNANGQKFLNKYEKEFTSMYVYGRYTL